MAQGYRRLTAVGLMAGLLILTALPALAEDTHLAIYDEGSFSFRYDQWPFGSYDGNFAAAGTLIDSLLWGSEQLRSCGGSMEVVSDTTLAWCYGAVYNTDDTVDLAAVFIRSAGELNPGTYNVDIETFMAGFAFMDGITNFTFPDLGGDLFEWVNSLQAEYTFYPMSGSIYVSAVSDTEFIGTFSGMMTDPDDLIIIEISNGSFNMSGYPVMTSAPAATPLLLSHGVHPNPFNPKTRLSLNLNAGSEVEIGVYDPTGRRVAILREGWLEAGQHHLDWNGEDPRGRSLPAGLYLYRIVTERESGSGKMLLLP